MKKLSTCLFLVLFSFSAPSLADDIRDFQIEGMSIGDSALNYFSKKEIKDNANINYYTNNKYTPVEFFQLSSFKTYDSVGLRYKTDDKKYIIVGISGTLFCEKNIEKCNKKQKEIDLEISNMFENAQKDVHKNKHTADKSGKSTTSQINYWFKSKEVVSIELIDWSEKITNEKGWTDNVSVLFYTSDFAQWIIDDSQN
jgi:hypothetical protein